MKNNPYALAGLVFGGIGVLLGIALSSSVPNTPLVFGTAVAVYAAVVAAVIGGLRKHGRDLSRE
jgi:small basic protein